MTAPTWTRLYGSVVVTPPPPRRAVMPCSDCRKMLDRGDMRRVGHGVRANGSPVLGRIVCADRQACANRTRN